MRLATRDRAVRLVGMTNEGTARGRESREYCGFLRRRKRGSSLELGAVLPTASGSVETASDVALVEGVGHYLHMTRPDQFKPLMVEAIASILNAPSRAS